MIFSFFGLLRPASAVCDALIKSINNYRLENNGAYSPVEAGGVYVPNLTKCVNFASQRSMAAYMNGQELIKKSDIIFIFVADHTLRAFAKSMRRHNITGKIFCHFNPAYDADILDFDPDNTYVSCLLPVMKKNGVVDFSNGLIIEGYGKRYDEFSECLKTLGIMATHLTSDEKCIYQSAVNMTIKLSEYSNSIAAKLVKSVTGSDTKCLEAVRKYNKSADYEFTFYDPIESGDEEYIDNQRKLIKAMGFDDANLLYASLLLLEGTSEKAEMSLKLKEIAKNIVKKY